MASGDRDMAEDNNRLPRAYKELRGGTYEERAKECPPGYWCYKPIKDGVPDENGDTEVWADPHGIHCPMCKTVCIDTGLYSASFMCPNCGLSFGLDLFSKDARGRKVVLVRPAES